MSLFSALNTSTNGLRYTHDALGLLSQNVANASNPNYVRREYVFDQGLHGSTIRRALEPYVQRQMWQETANSGYSSAQSDIMSQLDQLYGSPDSKTNLSSSYNVFYSALQALRSDPSSSTQQSTLLSTAKLFASRLNSMSDNVQALRTGVEEAIG
ncbi:MAG: FlgK family flagellar hook-associated protein, partial [Hyphomicrobiales bacterium]